MTKTETKKQEHSYNFELWGWVFCLRTRGDSGIWLPPVGASLTRRAGGFRLAVGWCLDHTLGWRWSVSRGPVNDTRDGPDHLAAYLSVWRFYVNLMAKNRGAESPAR